MKKRLPIFFLAFVISFFTSFLLDTPTSVTAVNTNHIVISEIQIGRTSSATDEFVELYNPSLGAQDLTGWELRRKTASASAYELVATLSGVVASHGFFLVGHSNYSGTPSADILYGDTGTSIAANNSVLLVDALQNIVDKVGMGGTNDKEGNSTYSPATNKSIERKANENSIDVTMGFGGTDEYLGNGQDTDNNMLDFYLRSNPQPQNSHSSLEPVLSSPTPTVTEQPTATPTVTVSPTETIVPTTTLIPTETIAPTTTVSPTLTLTPTITTIPTVTTTPTLTPPPTNSPIIVGVFPYGAKTLVCKLYAQYYVFGTLRINFPHVKCSF